MAERSVLRGGRVLSRPSPSLSARRADPRRTLLRTDGEERQDLIKEGLDPDVPT